MTKSVSLSVTELATRISRALITESSSTRSWTPSLEHTLHRLGCRDSLSPALVARVIDPFLLSHHSLALGFFNWASHQPNFSHTSVSYHSIITSLSSSSHFNAMEALFREARARRVSLDASVHGSVVASLLARGKALAAFGVFREVGSRAEELGPGICNSLMASLASDGHLDHARVVLDEMSRRGVLLTTLGFGVFVWRLSERVELDVVLGLLDEVKVSEDSEINGSILALLVAHGLCRGSRVSDALTGLDELRCRMCKPDFMAYRVVSEGFRLNFDELEAEKVLKKKRKLGVAPRMKDYIDFILLLVSERRLVEAKELGEVIIEGNFPIEPNTLNFLIGSVSTVDPCSMIKYLEFMIEKEIFPNLLTLTELSKNLCEHNKVDELLGMLKLLSSRDYFNDVERYDFMISSLCNAGRLREAYGILREMKMKGVGPNISSYNIVLEACCREDLIRAAKRLWDEIVSIRLVGNLRTYNILIQKLSEIGQIEETQSLFRHMCAKGVVPDAMIYTALLRVLCQESMLGPAFEILKKAEKQDSLLGQNMLSTYIIDLCKKGLFVAASELLCQFDNPCSESHVVVLKCLADSSEIPVAMKHITWLRKTSPSMLRIVSDELSASLPSSSKPEPIKSILSIISQDLP